MKKTIFLTFAFLMLLSSFGSAITGLNESLTQYYTMDDANITGTTVLDIMGAHNGSLENTPTTGQSTFHPDMGEAIDFDGATETIDISGMSNFGTDDFTFSIWANLGSTGGSIMGRRGGNHEVTSVDATFDGHGMYLDDRLGTQCGCFIQQESDTSNNLLGQWTHVVIVVNQTGGNTWTAQYINGTRMQQVTASGQMNFDSSSRVFSIAGLGLDDGENSDGTYDEVAIYRGRAMTDADVLALYNNYTSGIRPFDAPAGPSTVTITQTTYNVTSAFNVGNRTLWATNTSDPVHTTDATPTVKFSTDLASNCTIGTVDQNYTDMLAGDANRKCGTTDVTDHTCTMPTTDKAAEENELIYISCVGSAGVEGAASTSGALSLKLMSTISGTYQNGAGELTNNATVYIIRQSDNTLVQTLQSNSSGGWTTNVDEGIYIVVGYEKNDSTEDADADPHVNVTIPTT